MKKKRERTCTATTARSRNREKNLIYIIIISLLSPSSIYHTLLSVSPSLIHLDPQDEEKKGRYLLASKTRLAFLSLKANSLSLVILSQPFFPPFVPNPAPVSSFSFSWPFSDNRPSSPNRTIKLFGKPPSFFPSPIIIVVVVETGLITGGGGGESGKNPVGASGNLPSLKHLSTTPSAFPPFLCNSYRTLIDGIWGNMDVIESRVDWGMMMGRGGAEDTVFIFFLNSRVSASEGGKKEGEKETY
jgi:hypothetical protein